MLYKPGKERKKGLGGNRESWKRGGERKNTDGCSCSLGDQLESESTGFHRL